MADSSSSPTHKLPSFIVSLASSDAYPIIPEAFISTYLKENDDLVIVKLISDAYDKTWPVTLIGGRVAAGWEAFSAAHRLRIDDELIFRDVGTLRFHVEPSGRRRRSDDGSDDVRIDSGDETWDNVSHKKTSRARAESPPSSSSSEKSCILGVTPSSLRLNQVYLAKSFTDANGLHKSWCEIDVMNQSGESWVMSLRHNKSTGQESICGGWRSFCHENELKTGSSYRFELVLTGTRPALQLCSDKTCSNAKFMTVTLKPYMLMSRQLHLPNSFVRVNGIKRGDKIILVDKNGGAWPSHVASNGVNRQFYLTKGWLKFCKASGINTGETFTLKFVRAKGKTPKFQFFSKSKTKRVEEPTDEGETETRFRKKARVSAEGEPSQASHKSTVDPEKRNCKCKQPLQTDHQMKQIVVDALADMRRFRSELEIKEQKLEVLLELFD